MNQEIKISIEHIKENCKTIKDLSILEQETREINLYNKTPQYLNTTTSLKK
jgi:hypothetical protein